VKPANGEEQVGSGLVNDLFLFDREFAESGGVKGMPIVGFDLKIAPTC
jgi:hypothetical protein